MNKRLLLGDEAIAQAAIDAGISGVYAYPGTPSTEIATYIQQQVKAHALAIVDKWATNEKTALEAALGLSYVGKRALCCMKHVGLNVAADAFMNAAMTGVRGGLVIVAADDPSMHSSQNEQDSRFYGDFAMIPILEPACQQEAYDMMRYAFDLSESLQTPVLMRITTRLAHARAGVQFSHPPLHQKEASIPLDTSSFVLLPAISRRQYKRLLTLQTAFEQAAQDSPYNFFKKGVQKKTGVIACGITINYLDEYFTKLRVHPTLKVSQYPISRKQVMELLDYVDEVLVLEEGAPFVERQLRGLLNKTFPIKGRLDGTLPRDGELSPDIVAEALQLPHGPVFEKPAIVMPRPPALCKGCGHRDVYTILNDVLKSYPQHRIFGDIGCYTLGALPPFLSIHSCVDMGASITMAKGAADGGIWPAIAIIGDSTFAHSGMTGLLDCVNAHASVTIILSDNETTAMTGGQDSAACGRLEQIVAGLGVDPDHIRVFVPLPKNYEMMRQIIDEEINYQGVSVIIPRRECLQTLKRKKA